MLPHIYKDNGTISIGMPDGNMKMIDTAHKNYNEIVAGMKAGEDDKVIELINIASQLERAVRASSNTDNVTIVDGEVLFQGEPIHNSLTTRIITMADEGFDIGHMVLFLENLMMNPSFRAVNELYNFLEAGAIPITENGTFLTYKKIREDYTDVYTGAYDNSIGAEPEMPRNRVNEDSSQTCSAGLHVCSYDYLPSFGSSTGDRVVICEVHPRDVVSIPDDYNNTKMRVCKYKVIGEVEDYKEVDVFEEAGSVMMTDNVPQPQTISEASDEEVTVHGKAIGKMVSNRLDNEESTTETVKTALALLNLPDDVIDDLINGSNKKVGKKISKAIRDRVMEPFSFEDAFMEAQNNEMEEHSCADCGSELDLGDDYCEDCREDDEEVEDNTPDTDFCLKCGTTLIDGMDMCPSCGYNLTMVSDCVLAAKNLGKTIDGDLASGGSTVAVFKAFTDIGVDIYSLIDTTLMSKLLSDNNIGHSIEELIKRKIIDGAKFSVAYIDAKNAIGNEVEDEESCPRCGAMIADGDEECDSCGYFIV